MASRKQTATTTLTEDVASEAIDKVVGSFHCKSMTEGNDIKPEPKIRASNSQKASRFSALVAYVTEYG